MKSYVVPDSDDEDIVMEGEDDILQKFAKKRRQETNMQRWIKQLAILFKEEQRKVCVPICLTLARDVHSTFCIMSLGKLRAARDLRVLRPVSQYNERKRRIHASSPPGTKVKVSKVRAARQRDRK